MNLIRVALFAVMAFMGTVSLSAQNWHPPVQALQDIQSALKNLADAPVPQPPVQSNLSGPVSSPASANMKNNCPTCLGPLVKAEFLKLVAEQIKGGVDTQTAVSNVHNYMTSNLPAGNPMTAQMTGHIEAAWSYAVSILTN